MKVFVVSWALLFCALAGAGTTGSITEFDLTETQSKSVIDKMNNINGIDSGLQMGWAWVSGIIRCGSPEGTDDKSHKPYCTIGKLPSTTKAICTFSVKPDGTDPLKKIDRLTFDLAIPSKTDTAIKKMPINYKGSKGNESLKGDLEVISSYQPDDGILEFSVRYLPVNIKKQSNFLKVSLKPKVGSNLNLNLSFPTGEVQVDCAVE